MTTPRPWPNDMSAARDRAAELACESLSALKPVIESGVQSEVQTMRCLAVASINLQQICRLLESCGARTDPLNQALPSRFK